MTGFIKWIKLNKSLFILNAALIAFILLLSWLKPVDTIMDYESARLNPKGGTAVDIYGDIAISQSFTCSMADSFELYITSKNYHGFFEVKLFDSSDKCIKSWKVDKLDIKSRLMGDDQWLQFDAGKNVLTGGSEYRIEISAPELDKGNAITITTVSAEGPDIGDCMINGEKSEQVLVFSTYRDLGNPFFIIAVVILFVTADLWWFNRKKNIIKSALWILIGTGLIMLFIMAPGSQPDEGHHYYSAYKLSSIIMGKTNLNEIESYYEYDLKTQTNFNQSFEKVRTTIVDGFENETKMVPLFSGAVEKQPAAYLAPALGITLGRLLHGSFIFVYTLGRLFNMLLYIILAYAAIRLIPVNKELMLLISIMPMAMHQACSMSYDVIVNGTSLLFFAYIASFVFVKKTFTWFNALLCAVLLGIVGPVKVVYCILILLIFIIPKEQFKHSRDKLIMGLIVVIGVAAVLLLLRGATLSTQLSGEAFDPVKDYYHGSFVLQHPDRWVRLILRSAEASSWQLYKDGVGSRLSGANVIINEVYLICYIAILILAALNNNIHPEPILSRSQKFINIGIAVTGLAALFAIFSFVWTTYGAAAVSGMQGRYLIPFVPLALYSIAGNRITVNFERYKLIYLVWFVEAGFITEVMSKVVY